MLFLGAGASKPLGIPTMEGFTDETVSVLQKEDPQGATLVAEIGNAVSQFGFKPDIEAILTALSGLTDPVKALKTLGPLSAIFLEEKGSRFRDPSLTIRANLIAVKIEGIISERCKKIETSRANKLYTELYRQLSVGIGIPIPQTPNGWTSMREPVTRNIFTTNYDLGIESFLRARQIAFSDGFKSDLSGDLTFVGKWDQPTSVNLFKLHGSINYFVREDGKVVKLTPASEFEDLYGDRVQRRLMIYPVGEKHATKYPYFEYLEQLRSVLAVDEVGVVIGYSFRDVAINNAFEDGVRKNPNLRIILLSPDASNIRTTLENGLQLHVYPVDLLFENEKTPIALQQTVHDWRPSFYA